MAVAVDRSTGEHVTGPAATCGRTRMKEGAPGTNLAGIGRRFHVIEAFARALLGIRHGVQIRTHGSPARRTSGSSFLPAPLQRYERSSRERKLQAV